jgi:KUP system potassium uptake protein
MSISTKQSSAPVANVSTRARAGAAHRTAKAPSGEHTPQRRLAALAIAALGVVYGDIGTSPLYALREAFYGPHAIAPTPANIYGVLSLVFWALILVITLKYIGFIMRADNRGEGGILALTALATSIRPLLPSNRRWLVLLGVLGATLLYGDGVITPAISVLSAVEGLAVATPLFTPYIVPLTMLVLVGLFLLQRRRTSSIGQLFGPVMLTWFAVLAVLGVSNIAQSPGVLLAINPAHAFTFFAANGLHGYLVLGTVFLVVTGGEALYADMGHAGKVPIRLAWLGLVLPALLLNYFGQGALLLREPGAAANLFYHLAPDWALYPLIALSIVATVIASQAIIAGVFSITRQGENLGFLPRMRVKHTSPTTLCQIYIPFVNWALLLGCLAVVVGFRTSSNLAGAYGVAVTSTMAITTVILAIVARERWRWSLWQVGILIGPFLLIDLAFLGANLTKVTHGGWFPLVLAVVIFIIMTTWKRGNRLVNSCEQAQELPLTTVLARCRAKAPLRVAGVAVFLSANPAGTPAALLSNYRYNNVIHQHILLVHVHISSEAHVSRAKRVSVADLGQGFYRITINYGFTEELDVPTVLTTLKIPGLKFSPKEVPYFIGRTKALPSVLPGMALWREKLYMVMQRNATSAADFFHLPPAQVVEVSTSVEV